MIPFNRPYLTGNELKYIQQAHAKGHLSGDGVYTKKCHGWLEKKIGCKHALLTHSCTGALDMAATLADIEPGDEVIMPSYTFVSTANAFVLRGAVPVFVDIRPDTLNLDETKIEASITQKTRAIVPVHYAGVACKMDTIIEIAEKYNLLVIEDAAQGIESSYKGRPLGSIGHLAALSFHETKNISSGEGGALLINSPEMFARAEIIRDKGTNRSQFLEGLVDKYTWVDLGSSYSPSELIAAFLWAQMEEAKNITQRRLKIWNTYHAAFEHLEHEGMLRRPIVPADCTHNAHMYYLLLPDFESRSAFIRTLAEDGIGAVFHYVPLHSSPMGKKVGRIHHQLPNTENLSERLVRLPLWLGIEDHLPLVIRKISTAVI
ncbi:MAG: dTDP-4-amino-4,6-dideoxygalactose transaminase [Candidatus Scalindua sp.]